MSILPPPELQARLGSHLFSRKHFSDIDFEAPGLSANQRSGLQALASRRAFLKGASLALAGMACPALSEARGQAEPLIFAPEPDSPQAAPGDSSQVPQFVQQETLRLGEIPADFWQRPRELWLRRHPTGQETRIVYWRDGQLVADGYWQACAMLRDVRANVMTSMDPTLLDVLRGVFGFYNAWRWPHPIVITSGFRTVKTNNAIGEGAAKNSMHLYGRAADLHVPGVPTKDVAALGMHLQQGGVGFYPSKGFTHLDTGRLRLWKG